MDPRTDLFSFGIVLSELLAGVHPFRKSRQAATIGAILHEDPHPITVYVEEVPEGLEQTIPRMLAERAEDRYSSIGEVRADLIRLREEITSHVALAGGEKRSPLCQGGVLEAGPRPRLRPSKCLLTKSPNVSHLC